MSDRMASTVCRCDFSLSRHKVLCDQGLLGESSPATEFLILGYGKKSNFRGGTRSGAGYGRYINVPLAPRSRMVPSLLRLDAYFRNYP